MPLENFALLGYNLDIGAGGLVVTTASADGSPRADIGQVGAMVFSAPSTLTAAGKLRWLGPESIVGGGVPVDDGETQNDSLVGVIESLPAIIAGYFLGSVGANLLAAVAPATLQIRPGVNLVTGNWTVTGSTFIFDGALNSTYVILVAGNASIDDPIFSSLPQNLVIVIAGSMALTTSAIRTVSGRWIVGAGITLIGDQLNVTGGQLLSALNGFLGIDISSNLSVITPAFIYPSVILASSLSCIALPNPAVC